MGLKSRAVSNRAYGIQLTLRFWKPAKCKPQNHRYTFQEKAPGSGGGNWEPFQQLKSDGWTDRPDKCHRFHMLPLKRLLFDAIFKASTTVTGQPQGCCRQSHCKQVGRWTIFMKHAHLGQIWYHSEPSDIPYSTNYIFSWPVLFCRFLQQVLGWLVVLKILLRFYFHSGMGKTNLKSKFLYIVAHCK